MKQIIFNSYALLCFHFTSTVLRIEEAIKQICVSYKEVRLNQAWDYRNAFSKGRWFYEGASVNTAAPGPTCVNCPAWCESTA